MLGSRKDLPKRSDQTPDIFSEGQRAADAFFHILIPPNQTYPVEVDPLSSTKAMHHPMQIAKGTDPIFQTIVQSPAYEKLLNEACISTTSRFDHFRIGLKHCENDQKVRWGYGVQNLSDIKIPKKDIPICPYLGVFSQFDSDTLNVQDPTAWDEFGIAKNVDKDMTCPWKMLQPGQPTKNLFKIDLDNNGVIRGWNLPFVLIDPMADGDLFKNKMIVDQRSMGPFFNHQCLNRNGESFSVRIYVYVLKNNEIVVVSSLEQENEVEEQGMCFHPDGSTTKVTNYWDPLKNDSGYKRTGLRQALAMDIPIFFSLKAIQPKEEIFIDYGTEYTAKSPFLEYTTSDLKDLEDSEISMDEIRTKWEDGKQEYRDAKVKIKYCCCKDCIKIENPENRSIFLLQRE
jgi:hypothetical protein